MWRCSLILVLILKFVSSASHGNEPQWRPLGPFDCTNVSTIVPGPPGSGRLYAVANRCLFRSDDKGQHWQWLLSGYINTVTMNFENSDELFAGSYWYLSAHSWDGGNTWEHLPTSSASIDIRLVISNPQNFREMYAATGGGIARSFDGGYTWEILKREHGLDDWNFSSLAIDPSDPSILFAGTDYTRLYRSTDSGETWQIVVENFSVSSFQAIAIDPNDGSRVYVAVKWGNYPLIRSLDGGNTWTKVGESLNVERGRGVAVGSDGTLYLSGSGGVFCSSDFGDTWESMGTLEMATAGIIVVDPDNPKIIYAYLDLLNWDGGFFTDTAELDIHSCGIFRWEKGRWIWVSRGVFGPEVNDVVFDRTQPDRIYAALKYKGIIQSNDGGESWISVNGGLDSPYGVAVATDADGIHAYAVLGDTLYKKKHENMSWERLPLNIEPTPYSFLWGSTVKSICSDPLRPGALYVATYSGLFKTVTGGEDWEMIGEELPTSKIKKVAIHPFCPETLFIAMYPPLQCADDYCFPVGPSVYRSFDSGNTWNSSFGGSYASDITISGGKDQVIYEAEYHGYAGFAYRSVDMGKTWQQIGYDFRGDGLIVVDASLTNSQVAYYGSVWSGVLRTRDAGETWVHLEKGIGDYHIKAMAVHPLDDEKVIVGTERSGLFLWSSDEPVEPDSSKGDVDKDESIDALDIVLTVKIFLGTFEPWPPSEDMIYRADMDNNGRVQVNDILMIVNEILEP